MQPLLCIRSPSKIFLFLFHSLIITTYTILYADALTQQKQQEYNYFAFGSNTVLSTLTALRQVEPISSTAAILPNYKLCFNIPGIPRIEPSWASVMQTSRKNNKQDVVHGVLHTVTAEDFAKIGNSEGVPFGYVWQSCNVIPYMGNGKDAGYEALLSSQQQEDEEQSNTVSAYTLVATPKPFFKSNDRYDIHIPPSRAYRDLIIRGAKEFQMDKEYIDFLESIEVSTNTLGRGLIAGEVLEFAEWIEKLKRQ